MRKLLLLLGLVALARLSYASGWERLISARSDANEVRIQSLNQQLDDIENSINSIGGDGVNTDTLGARVRKLTGNGCDGDFQCGGDAPQCVSTLAVCDHQQDCRNGADEEHCDNPVIAGSAWSGVIYWSSCNAHPETTVRIVITSTDRPAYFPSRVWLEAVVILDQDGDVESKKTTGFYNFGNNRFVIQPSGSQNIGVVCQFDGVDFSHCSGQVVKPSLDKCADVVLVRK